MGDSVRIDTSIGSFEVELYSQHAPRTAKNFRELCSRGYYDGAVFHRVIPNFMIQGELYQSALGRRTVFDF